MGTFSGVAVDVGLIKFVDAAHVRLEGEGAAHRSHSALLREKISIDDGAHGHVRPISHTQLLQIPSLVLFKSSSPHLFSRMNRHVSVKSLCLSSAIKTASF